MLTTEQHYAIASKMAVELDKDLVGLTEELEIGPPKDEADVADFNATFALVNARIALAQVHATLAEAKA